MNKRKFHKIMGRWVTLLTTQRKVKKMVALLLMIGKKKISLKNRRNKGRKEK